MLEQKGIPLTEDNNPSNNHSDTNGEFVRPREKGDAEFYKDIMINDLKNRYMLTRGATQSQIQRETGADVTTRGKYYPDKNLATDKEPPLYLHITASTQQALDDAVAKIEELIQTAQVPLPGTGYPPREERRPERKFFDTKIYVGIESSPYFNLRAKIVGPQGSYVKHIQNETGSRVQLKGKGSGFYETDTGVESEEDLHVHISCSRQEGLDQAVKLTQDLIDTVKQEHERASQYPHYGRGGYGGHHGGRGGYRGEYRGDYRHDYTGVSWHSNESQQ
ncbi:uncharacterized protein BYT42DRAFT_495765 [Radiomyces spectabilis]|uniref:uncharacterized protein n=1 Tax=Radiomyces spectabilis TaxID=64574 RepID=UPI002220BD8A|nr:uncharacterized protein BYT42DRAFT_495765 [Radiomyces spectabilis]KAI8379568.1 hypothetical protein BYT42DRAFT_495765 [Radiomyces spectabilis]